MRKRLLTLFLAAALVFTVTIPALACTPSLDLDIWGDLTPPCEIEYEPSDDIKAACDNAAKKYLEEHPIELTPSETETDTETELETETESETVVETEPETARKCVDWKKYIPKSLRARWLNIVRR